MSDEGSHVRPQLQHPNKIIDRYHIIFPLFQKLEYWIRKSLSRKCTKSKTKSLQSCSSNLRFGVHVPWFTLIHRRMWSKVLQSSTTGQQPEKIWLLSIDIHRIAQPLCLGMLIQYFHAGNTMPTWQAYGYATGVVLSAAVYTLTIHPYFYRVQHLGMRIRVAACSLIYRKVY